MLLVVRKTLGLLGLLWGLAGILFLLGGAVYRLSPVALEALTYELSSLQWAVLIGNVLFMAWSEGYKGFQKSFSPRVAARLRWLYQHPCPLLVISAPLFSLGLVHAPPKRRVIFFALTAMIIGLIILIRLLDQPWRGVLDAGVVVGLTWGTISLLWFVVLAFTQQDYAYSPELPEASSKAYEAYCASATKTPG